MGAWRAEYRCRDGHSGRLALGHPGKSFVSNVSLLRWLRRQLREPNPQRERLEAAIANDDPAEARRLVALMPFSDDQRHHVERLLEEWERGRSD